EQPFRITAGFKEPAYQHPTVVANVQIANSQLQVHWQPVVAAVRCFVESILARKPAGARVLEAKEADSSRLEKRRLQAALPGLAGVFRLVDGPIADRVSYLPCRKGNAMKFFTCLDWRNLQSLPSRRAGNEWFLLGMFFGHFLAFTFCAAVRHQPLFR